MTPVFKIVMISLAHIWGWAILWSNLTPDINPIYGLALFMSMLLMTAVNIGLALSYLFDTPDGN